MFAGFYTPDQFVGERHSWRRFGIRALNLIVALGVAFILCYITACGDRLSDDELAAFDQSVRETLESRLEAAVRILNSNGIEAATSFCSEMIKSHTQFGSFWVNCTVAADFYDPNDKVIVEGNEVILPVSLYMQAQNGLHLLEGGYRFREVTISAFARRGIMGEFFASLKKEIEGDNTS